MTRAAVAAALPAGALLAVDPGGLAPFGPLKWAVTATAALAAFSVLAWRRPLLVARRPVALWGALLAWVGIAAFTGIDPLYAWIGTPERHFGAAAWLLCALAFVAGQGLDRVEARRVLKAATAAIGIAGAWALAEQVGWEPIDLAGAGPRPVGPLGSSAMLGAAAALLGPVAAGVALDRTTSRGARWASAAAAVLAGAALVVSGARAAWVGALVALVAVAVTRRRAGNSFSQRVVLGGAVAAAVAAALGVVTGVSGRVPDAFTAQQGGLGGRVDEWRVAARAISAHPLTGVGPEGYRIVFGRHVDDAYEQTHGRDPLPDRAHSTPVDVAVTLGVPGVALFAVLIGVVARFVVRALRRGDVAIAGAAGGLIAYATQSLFLFPVAELEPVAWLLAGVVAAAMAGAEERITIWMPRPVLLASAVLAVVVVGTGALDVAADRAARTTVAAISEGRIPGPGDAARLRPDAVRYHLVAARAHAAAGTVRGVDRALADVGRALDRSPEDPVARMERCRLLLERARLTEAAPDIARARGALERLQEDDPRNAALLLRLGLAAALDGDHGAAEQAWLEAERLAPRSAAASVDLAVAYARAGRWAEARAAAHRALVRDPGNRQALDVLERAGGT
jgi:O-antigen ligase